MAEIIEGGDAPTADHFAAIIQYADAEIENAEFRKEDASGYLRIRARAERGLAALSAGEGAPDRDRRERAIEAVYRAGLNGRYGPPADAVECLLRSPAPEREEALWKKAEEIARAELASSKRAGLFFPEREQRATDYGMRCAFVALRAAAPSAGDPHEVCPQNPSKGGPHEFDNRRRPGTCYWCDAAAPQGEEPTQEDANG